MDRKLPNRLYKYRKLNNRTLDMLLNDQVYFADPSTFNDPLDTRPSLEPDVENEKLEKIYRELVKLRTDAEMRAAAKSLRYRGPRTTEHIRRQSRRQADRQVKQIEFYSEDAHYDSEDSKRNHLRRAIESELFRQFDRGIVSLAQGSLCPLMWSHYADQHRGVCIGYSVPPHAKIDLHEVRYQGDRLVRAFSVAAMLEGSQEARNEVDQAVLLRKAGSWNYEREWRLFGPLGLQNSPLELEEIIFGMRCTESAKYVVMKAMEGRDPAFESHEIYEDHGKFLLKKRPLQYDNPRFEHYPRRAVSPFGEFEDLTAIGSP